jgi:hypothetical protein
MRLLNLALYLGCDIDSLPKINQFIITELKLQYQLIFKLNRQFAIPDSTLQTASYFVITFLQRV